MKKQTEEEIQVIWAQFRFGAGELQLRGSGRRRWEPSVRNTMKFEHQSPLRPEDISNGIEYRIKPREG